MRLHLTYTLYIGYVYKRQVLYVYYVIDNKEVVSRETHRFPFSITHQRSFSNVRQVLINIFNVKIDTTILANTAEKIMI